MESNGSTRVASLDELRELIKHLSASDRLTLAREMAQTPEEKATLAESLLKVPGVQVVFCGSNQTTADIVVQIQHSPDIDAGELIRAVASLLDKKVNQD